jgi:hypothetical protein
VRRRPGQNAGIDWDAQPLGEMYDHVLAELLGVSSSSVGRARRHRGIKCSYGRNDWDAQPLGEVSDSELARCIGAAPNTVSHARAKRGIAALRPRPKAYDVDWDTQPLGEEPDDKIALLLGVPKAVVQRTRAGRGILPGKRRCRCACGRTFAAHHSQQRWCSVSCNTSAHTARRLKYDERLVPAYVALAAIRREVVRQRKGETR